MDLPPETRNEILKLLEDVMNSTKPIQQSLTRMSNTLDRMILASDRIINVCSGKSSSAPQIESEIIDLEVEPKCVEANEICDSNRSSDKTNSSMDICLISVSAEVQRMNPQLNQVVQWSSLNESESGDNSVAHAHQAFDEMPQRNTSVFVNCKYSRSRLMCAQSFVSVGCGVSLRRCFDPGIIQNTWFYLKLSLFNKACFNEFLTTTAGRYSDFNMSTLCDPIQDKAISVRMWKYFPGVDDTAEDEAVNYLGSETEFSWEPGPLGLLGKNGRMWRYSNSSVVSVKWGFGMVYSVLMFGILIKLDGWPPTDRGFDVNGNSIQYSCTYISEFVCLDDMKWLNVNIQQSREYYTNLKMFGVPLDEISAVSLSRVGKDLSEQKSLVVLGFLLDNYVSKGLTRIKCQSCYNVGIIGLLCATMGIKRYENSKSVLQIQDTRGSAELSVMCVVELVSVSYFHMFPMWLNVPYVYVIVEFDPGIRCSLLCTKQPQLEFYHPISVIGYHDYNSCQQHLALVTARPSHTFKNTTQFKPFYFLSTGSMELIIWKMVCFTCSTTQMGVMVVFSIQDMFSVVIVSFKLTKFSGADTRRWFYRSEANYSSTSSFVSAIEEMALVRVQHPYIRVAIYTRAAQHNARVPTSYLWKISWNAQPKAHIKVPRMSIARDQYDIIDGLSVAKLSTNMSIGDAPRFDTCQRIMILLIMEVSLQCQRASTYSVSSSLCFDPGGSILSLVRFYISAVTYMSKVDIGRITWRDSPVDKNVDMEDSMLSYDTSAAFLWMIAWGTSSQVHYGYTAVLDQMPLQRINNSFLILFRLQLLLLSVDSASCIDYGFNHAPKVVLTETLTRGLEAVHSKIQGGRVLTSTVGRFEGVFDQSTQNGDIFQSCTFCLDQGSPLLTACTIHHNLHSVCPRPVNQSYAQIIQDVLLLQDAITNVFELIRHVQQSCIQWGLILDVIVVILDECSLTGDAICTIFRELCWIHLPNISATSHTTTERQRWTAVVLALYVQQQKTELHPQIIRASCVAMRFIVLRECAFLLVGASSLVVFVWHIAWRCTFAPSSSYNILLFN